MVKETTMGVAIVKDRQDLGGGTLTARPMIYTEARECVTKINDNMNNIRSLVLELYERKGWEALGYSSWRECVVKEFKQSQSYLYYQLEAAKAERAISTMVEKPAEIPERTLRPLTKLKDDPKKQREAWQKALETAPEGKVTAAHVQKVVREMVEPASKPKQQEIKVEFTNAMMIAAFVVSHLERLMDHSPEIIRALDKVQRWIDNKRSTQQSNMGRADQKSGKAIIKTESVSAEFEDAYERMVTEIKNARAMGWKTTSHKGAVELMETLMDIVRQ